MAPKDDAGNLTRAGPLDKAEPVDIEPITCSIRIYLDEYCLTGINADVGRESLNRGISSAIDTPTRVAGQHVLTGNRVRAWAGRVTAVREDKPSENIWPTESLHRLCGNTRFVFTNVNY